MLGQAQPDEISQLDAMISQAEAADSAGDQGKAEKREEQPPATGKTEDKTAPEEGKIENIDDLIKSDTQADADKAKAKDEKPKDKPEDKGEENLSRYEKAKRREAAAWNKINEEKTRIAEERAAIAKEREQFQATKPNTVKFTAEQYEVAAEKFEAQGKFDLAEAAREEAKNLRANPPKAEPQGETKPVEKSKEFVDTQKKYWDAAKKEMPELIDPKSPVNATFKEILKVEPEFLQHPKGPYFAAKLAKAETAAARVPELENQVGTLKTELEKLKKLTALPENGIPGQIKPEKAFHEMSVEEQERELEKELALSR